MLPPGKEKLQEVGVRLFYEPFLPFKLGRKTFMEDCSMIRQEVFVIHGFLLE